VDTPAYFKSSVRVQLSLLSFNFFYKLSMLLNSSHWIDNSDVKLQISTWNLKLLVGL